MTCVSILMPVYNEVRYVAQVVAAVLEARLPDGVTRELVIVDDASTDGTPAILEALAREEPERIKYVRQETNHGKGAAVRRAIELAGGEVCVIQDADLEYDPADLAGVLAPILSGEADVVYGTRFPRQRRSPISTSIHALGNRALTWLSNRFTGLDLTDMETCYKAARTSLLKSIPLRSNRFGIEPELTAKFARRGCRLREAPISYRPRARSEGKKITWVDAIRAVLVILRYAVLDDSRRKNTR